MKKILFFTSLLVCSMNAMAFFENQIYVTGLSTAKTAAAATANTNAIQAAFNQAATLSSTVNIIGQDVWFDGVSGNRGVVAVSNMKLNLDRTRLKLYPNSSFAYNFFRVLNGASNIIIDGNNTGSIVGDRLEHIYGAAGVDDYGMGVNIGGASNVTVRNLKSSNMTGDGFFIGNSPNTGILLDNVISDNNRRQGLSITYCDGCTVSDSTFSNTNGTTPALGMDIEPDSILNPMKNIIVTKNKVFNNFGGGIKTYNPSYTGTNFSNVVISNNLVDEIKSPMVFSNVRNITVEQNVLKSASNECVVMVGATNNMARNNVCARGVIGGAALYAPISTTRPNTGNTFTGNVIKAYGSVFSPASLPASSVVTTGNILN